MQTNDKHTKKVPWIRIGFGIGLSVSVLSWLGIAGLLSIIEASKLPEEELVVFSSLFYGVIFFIALGGVRAESRRHKLLIAKKPFEVPPPPPTKRQATMIRIKTVLWKIINVVSLGWLTPALVIYWAGWKHPEWALAACACFSSLLAGVYYMQKRTEKRKTTFDHSMFIAGEIIGVGLIIFVMV